VDTGGGGAGAFAGRGDPILSCVTSRVTYPVTGGVTPESHSNPLTGNFFKQCKVFLLSQYLTFDMTVTSPPK
jgi:hypothetical protein